MASPSPNLRFSDKLLVEQPEHTHLYKGTDYAEDLYQTICRASGIGNPHEELDLVHTDRFTLEQMGSNPVSLRFLQFLLKVAGARRVLEIGTFIGVSAIYFARALPPGGKVVTIEKFDHFAGIARQNIARNGVADRVEVLDGDAHEVLRRLPPGSEFDFVFIDGNKERYRDYVQMTEPFLSAKGVIVVDDCFFHGDAVNARPTSEKGAGARAALDYASTRADLVKIALPLANGMLLLTRR